MSVTLTLNGVNTLRSYKIVLVSKMEQDGKKISFGFSKSTKKINIFQKPPTKPNNVQLIDCLEAQTIKIKGALEKTKEPLIIPMVQSAGNLLDRRRELKAKRELKSESEASEKPDSELTVDELAARELIREAQNANIKQEGKIYSLPLASADVIEIEGKEEATIEDYESVPISDYGMAMLRGMGWSEGGGIGKSKRSAKVLEPTLRPKGMGLGANKGAKEEEQKKPAVDKDGKELILKTGAYAKIVDGKQKGNYGMVQGLDDESGRVIIKTALQGLILSLNEFLVKPVTKEEYNQSSKVINNAKYEEYKTREENNKLGHKSIESDEIRKKDKTSTTASSSKPRTYSSDEDSKHCKSKDRSYENGKERDKHKSKSKKKHRSSSRSSTDSYSNRRDYKGKSRSSPVSDYKYKGHSKKKSKSKNRHKDSSDSEHNYRHKSHKSSKHKRSHH